MELCGTDAKRAWEIIDWVKQDYQSQKVPVLLWNCLIRVPFLSSTPRFFQLWIIVDIRKEQWHGSSVLNPRENAKGGYEAALDDVLSYTRYYLKSRIQLLISTSSIPLSPSDGFIEHQMLNEGITLLSVLKRRFGANFRLATQWYTGKQPPDSAYRHSQLTPPCFFSLISVTRCMQYTDAIRQGGAPHGHRPRHGIRPHPQVHHCRHS